MKILIVDDDGPLRRTLKRMLATDGHEVIEAETEAVAVAVLEGQVPPDGVLTDLRLSAGAGSGFGILAAARRAGVPAVLMTADVGPIDTMHPVMEKPFDHATLRIMVRAMDVSGSGKGSH